MKAFYNEIDRYCCDWLSNLMDAGLITPGKIDDRPIQQLDPASLDGYERVHFFAGIAGWDHALNLAGWGNRPVWTGSCPCQPFSHAGQMERFADERHLWPAWVRLIRERNPAIVFGEQVASATEWLRLVRSDLDALGYAVGCLPIEAASAGADHLRDRFWFVADCQSERWREGWPEHEVRRGRNAAAGNGGAVNMADANLTRSQGRIVLSECAGQRPAGADGPADATERSCLWEPEACERPQWETGGLCSIEWVIGADGKSRRVKSGIRLLADGVSNRVAKLRAFGNAIDPRPAAQFIAAFMEADT
jgi:DNA (cytosine-5)-methyltransferase 1